MVECQYQFDVEQIGPMSELFDDWFIHWNQHGVHRQGILINTAGFAAERTSIRSTLLAADQTTFDNFIAVTLKAGELRNRTDSIFKEIRQSCTVHNSRNNADLLIVYPNYMSEPKQIDVYAYGPFVHGFMNKEASSFSSNGRYTINESFRTQNTETSEYFLKSWVKTVFDETRNMDGGLLDYKIWTNKRGYQTSMTFVNAEAFFAYKVFEATKIVNSNSTDTIQTHYSQTSRIFA